MDDPSEAANWHRSAACRHADPELFFPVGTAGPALEEAERAKQVCAACPVQAPCLKWALEHSVAFGIWGGLTEAERLDLRLTQPSPALPLPGR